MSNDQFEFTRTLLILGNLAILTWVLLASLSFTFVSPLHGWLFLAFTAAMLFLILRRIGCNSCYYCKTCTSGFGRLSAWFFGKRQLKDLRNKTTLAFVAIVYCLLAVIPSASMVVSIFQEFTALKIIVLSGLLFISIYSTTTWLKPRQ